MLHIIILTISFWPKKYFNYLYSCHKHPNFLLGVWKCFPMFLVSILPRSMNLSLPDCNKCCGLLHKVIYVYALSVEQQRPDRTISVFIECQIWSETNAQRRVRLLSSIARLNINAEHCFDTYCTVLTSPLLLHACRRHTSHLPSPHFNQTICFADSKMIAASNFAFILRQPT